MHGTELRALSDLELRDRLMEHVRAMAAGGDAWERAKKVNPSAEAVYAELSRRSVAGLLGVPQNIPLVEFNEKIQSVLMENSYEWPQWSRNFLNQNTVVAKNAVLIADLLRATTREERVKYAKGLDPAAMIAFQGAKRRCDIYPVEDPPQSDKEAKEKRDKEISRCKGVLIVEIYRRVLQ